MEVKRWRHNEPTATETAGIQRIVCGTCAQVSFDYLYDAFEEERAQLEFDAE